MSEKIYAWLLRLYPAHFREKYGEEALQLLRDRARDETGFLQILQLWLDLLTDLVISIPREYRSVGQAVVGSAVQRVGCGPTFFVLEDGAQRLRAFACGGILSLAVLATVAGLLIHVGAQQTFGAATHRGFASNTLRSYPSASAASQNTENSRPGFIADSSPAALVPVRAIAPQTEGQSSMVATVREASGAAQLDSAQRRRVIDGATANLKQFYFDKAVAQRIGDALVAHEKNGDDDAATQGEVFSDLLTRQMRDTSHDMHLELEYSQEPLPIGPPAETPDGLEHYRQSMLQQNCMIRKVTILPDNVGYLKLDFFPDASLCESKLRAAMASLNDSDAIIFDLRDNSGGFENTVALIASYLFDRPEYMYSPRGAPTEDSWTRSPVPGNRLSNKPVYVLTSSTTWSGAEQFSYDLKKLKRATLVGETTRGGAHVGTFHRIDDHFGMGIPEEKAINPFGKGDWEGVGVEPDVKVKAADALDTARKLAEKKLHNKYAVN
jgi:hypothetical protein